MKRLSSIAMGFFLVGFTVSGCSQLIADGGWITLFDGSNLDNWNSIGKANWRLADGLLQADKGNGYLVSKNSYTDFQIRAEFWVDDDANSGIFIRCADPQKIGSSTCYEINIYDKRPEPDYGTGAIVNVAKVSPMPKAGGRWNTMEITAKGPQLSVTLNGTRTVDVQDSKHAAGPFALQYGAGVVKFRKVQIKPDGLLRNEMPSSYDRM
jgi:hypothetical protein